MIFLDSIEIEAFRGFSDRQKVRLDADAIVVTGANGLGKTSLTDALTWLLTGDLPQMPERQSRRGEEYVVNRYRDGEDAEVVLVVRHETGLYRIQRQGSSKRGSSVTVETGKQRLVGKEAERHLWWLFGAESEQALSTAVHAWGVLRQDAMRAVLTAPAEEFQSRLRDILGLGVLARFEQATQDAHRRAKEDAGRARRDFQEAQQALTRTEIEVRESHERLSSAVPVEQELATARSRVLELRDVLIVSDEAVQTVDSVRQLDGRASSVEEVLRAARGRIPELLAQTSSASDEDRDRLHLMERRMAALEAEHAQAQGELTQAEALYGGLQERANELAQLAALALPLIVSECPVCAQSIDPESVRTRLRAILAEAGEGTDLAVASDLVLQCRQRSTEVAAALRAQSESADVVRTRVARREQAVVQLEELQHEIRSASENADLRLPLLNESPTDPGAIDLSLGTLSALRRALSLVTRSARERGVETRLPRLEQGLDEAREKAASASRTLEALARRESAAKQLADAATSAGLDVTQDSLQALDPYFGEVFRRLAAHPTFSELGLQHDVYYGKARTWALLSDPIGGIEANPQLICSEGQLNVVALSYFIAFVLTAGNNALPFVILDDPLQSLDDMNVLGFADLCRHLRDGRQVIVTTHDSRFAALLSRKLKPRRDDQTSARIQFSSWDRGGPRLEVEHYIGTAEAAMLSGNGHRSSGE